MKAAAAVAVAVAVIGGIGGIGYGTLRALQSPPARADTMSLRLDYQLRTGIGEHAPR
jgi:hypothetical protein